MIPIRPRAILLFAILSGLGLRADRTADLFPLPQFDVYPRPVGAVIGDLDGDGDADIFTGFTSLMGEGDGAFPVRVAAPHAGMLFRDGVLVDLDRDGRLDVAAFRSNRSSIQLARGNGDGTFGPATFYAVGNVAAAIASGDFNADGIPDLIVANALSDDLSVFLGDGTGGLTPERRIAAGDNPASLAVGDFNADGRLDLVVANTNSDDVVLLVGDGSGNFQARQPIVVGDGPVSIAVTDLDRDGLLDFIVANRFSSDIATYLGRGNGKFTAAGRIVVSAGPTRLRLADRNGDGVEDLAILTSAGISVYLGGGSASFSLLADYEIAGYLGLASWFTGGDLNGDGLDELVSFALGSAPVIIRTGDDGSLLVPRGVAANRGATIAKGDFNRDGRIDLAAAHYWENEVRILLGAGDGTFSGGATYPAGVTPMSVAVADLDGGGSEDLAVVNRDSDDVSIFLGNGDGTFRPESRFIVGQDPIGVVVADFNDDRLPDLAVTNRVSQDLSILLGTGGGSLAGQIRIPVDRNPLYLAVADFDRDGRQDLAVSQNEYGHPALALISVLFGNGDGTFRAGIPLPVPGQRMGFILTGDFDADGDDDIASGSNIWPYLIVLLNRGDGTFDEPDTYRTWTPQYFDSEATDIAIGDFNNDGRPDLFASGYYSESASVFFGIGNGCFSPALIHHAGYQPNNTVVADYDRDGRDDLAISSWGRSAIVLIPNQSLFPGVCNDADGDGYGVPGDPSCPSGAVADCDDTDPSIAPDASDDTCDGIDQDCDGADGLYDRDDDGFTICEGDCQDFLPAYHPRAAEQCNSSSDLNCDGFIATAPPPTVAADAAFTAAGESLVWSPSPESTAYHAYRGSLGAGAFAYDHVCFAPNLAESSMMDASAPLAGQGFYYVISGDNVCGEGPLGLASSGDARPNPLPCP